MHSFTLFNKVTLDSAVEEHKIWGVKGQDQEENDFIVDTNNKKTEKLRNETIIPGIDVLSEFRAPLAERNINRDCKLFISN
jgi:hypothetical protein